MESVQVAPSIQQQQPKKGQEEILRDPLTRQLGGVILKLILDDYLTFHERLPLAATCKFLLGAVETYCESMLNEIKARHYVNENFDKRLLEHVGEHRGKRCLLVAAHKVHLCGVQLRFESPYYPMKSGLSSDGLKMFLTTGNFTGAAILGFDNDVKSVVHQDEPLPELPGSPVAQKIFHMEDRVIVCFVSGKILWTDLTTKEKHEYEHDHQLLLGEMCFLPRDDSTILFSGCRPHPERVYSLSLLSGTATQLGSLDDIIVDSCASVELHTVHRNRWLFVSWKESGDAGEEHHGIYDLQHECHLVSTWQMPPRGAIDVVSAALDNPDVVLATIRNLESLALERYILQIDPSSGQVSERGIVPLPNRRVAIYNTTNGAFRPIQDPQGCTNLVCPQLFSEATDEFLLVYGGATGGSYVASYIGSGKYTSPRALYFV